MPAKTKAYVALAFICIAWGTTYLAIRVGVMAYPPLLFAGARQVLAGLILGAVAYFYNRRSDFSLPNVGRQMWVGFLMLTFGNGCVTWAEKYVPSGVAALICSLMPIFAVSVNLFTQRNERFNAWIITGMLMGTLGVGLIFRNDLQALASPGYLAGIGIILFGTCSWALGSIYNKKQPAPVNPFLNSAMQLFFGGLFMLLVSPFTDNYHLAHWYSRDALLAFGYLVVFGSVLAYAAYMYALSHLAVGIATIYAYINPLVAVVLGFLVLHEPLNGYTLLSFIAIMVGVFLVNKGYRVQHQIKTVINGANAFPESTPES